MYGISLKSRLNRMIKLHDPKLTGATITISPKNDECGYVQRQK